MISRILGSSMAFQGGLSFNLDDVIIPEIKEELVRDAAAEVDEVVNNYNMGFITNNERYNQIIDIWTHANSSLTQKLMTQLIEGQTGIQPGLYDAGFRGPGFQGADPAAFRDAWTDGKTSEIRCIRW